MHEELKKEAKNREIVENDNQNINKRLQELSQQYDEMLKKKDDLLYQKADKESAELVMIKNHADNLEQRLKEEEEKYWKCSEDLVNVKKEVELQKGKNRELELEISSLKIGLTELRNQATSSQDEFEFLNNESNRKLKNLTEENLKMKEYINMTQNVKQALEERYNHKLNELQRVT